MCLIAAWFTVSFLSAGKSEFLLDRDCDSIHILTSGNVYIIHSGQIIVIHISDSFTATEIQTLSDVMFVYLRVEEENLCADFHRKAVSCFMNI